MELWVNIDFKEDLYRLHKADCIQVKKYTSETKGVNKLKTQEGWLRFETRHMARTYYQRNHHTLRWKPCKVCDP